MTVEVAPVATLAPGVEVFLRAVQDIWIVARVSAVGCDGDFDAIDAEGETWSVPIDQRGRAWRHLSDPSNPHEERRSLINICMLAGMREERERALAIVRASCVVGFGWVATPESVIKAIESGTRAEEPAHTSERAS